MKQLKQEKTDSSISLFLRFLKFGFLAWGGPVAQIATVKQELVEEEKWISREKFNRVLSIYQVLPGPEAHELCVYFGMLRHGRWGGFLAGLGFMLPGFLLMLLFSWLYVQFGLHSPMVAGLFLGCQPAVVALIVRAIHRLGEHAFSDRWLIGISGAVFIAAICKLSFALSLSLGGLAYFLKQKKGAAAIASLPLIVMVILGVAFFFYGRSATEGIIERGYNLHSPSLLALFGYGLRTGLLTFGGAYTAISFLQKDAVLVGQWMTNAQFLDGIALSGILPAPLIIFATFVGYLGMGIFGGIVMTAGIFLPAFSFSLIGHKYIEKTVENRRIHSFLDGVMAGVVGIISATAVELMRSTLVSSISIILFALSLFILYYWRSKVTVVFVILGAAIMGLLLR
ncbi:MAG: chromate efflux transporter [Deltaproteobacteria bacterium]|nr:chromate efflux transporter [Deltaproteobacteria bacterium]